MKPHRIFLAFLIFLVLVAVVGFLLALKSNVNTPPSQKACTLEAKICPDGSAVGRTGPNCEFAACPK